MPSIDSDSCHITSGCSGLPKLRQLTRATARPPAQATLSTDSATVAALPRRGSRRHQPGLASLETAMPRPVAGTPGPARRSRAASPSPGPSTVLQNSWWSYWEYTHEVSSSRRSRSAPQSAGGAVGEGGGRELGEERSVALSHPQPPDPVGVGRSDGADHARLHPEAGAH